MKHILIISLIATGLAVCWQSKAFAQAANGGDTLQVAMYVKVDRAAYKGDSIPNVTLHEFYKFPPRQFRNARQRAKYDKLVRDVRYVFPYAKLVRTILIEVRKISKTQGRLLVKLIDRECGQTSFEMIKAFVGTAKANMYNVLSSLFGNNLRKHYDPEGDDRDIERIVRMVESGQL